jgi:outer membrane protein assembly factor BamB
MIARFILLCLFLTPVLRAAEWPQWMGPQREGIWDESRLAERLQLAEATMPWEVPSGGGYAGPAVAAGRVYHFACHRRGEQKDTSAGLIGEEVLLCVDAVTGRTRWEKRWPTSYLVDYASGPRATPTVHGDRVYVLGAEGRLACLAVSDGTIHWEHELKSVLSCKSPIWGFAGHPLIWQNLVICPANGDGTACVAFDRLTGAEKWRALSAKQGTYCPPVLIHHAGRDQIILWHSDAICALDPATGKAHWTIPQETRFGVSMAAPVLSGDTLLVSSFWWGCLSLRLKTDLSTPEILWRTERESESRTTHLNALMCTPLLADGHLYGVCSYGQLRCLAWPSGERKWETFAATTGKEARWGNAFITRLGRTGDDYLLFNEGGDLIHATLTPDGYTEKSRRRLIEPNSPDVKERPVVWSHPAYANGHIFLRNDTALRCWRLVRD